MNHQFDELTKNLARSVTRRRALKQFGVGVAGMALAAFGLPNKAEAEKGGNCKPSGSKCSNHDQCCSKLCTGWDRWSKVCL